MDLQDIRYYSDSGDSTDMEPVLSMDILVEGQRLPDDFDDPSCSPIISLPRSAPGSRSSSFRNRPRPKLNIDIEAAQRPRTNSLPNAYLPIPEPFIPQKSGLCRVRSFKTTSKGLVNHGDSFKRSSSSLKSAGSSNSIHEGNGHHHHRKSSQDSAGDSHSSSVNLNNLYRVLLMGGVGVGKSSLARQFMTSEYKGTYTESTTPELGESERNVSVLLDGRESTLHFLDEEQHPDFEAEEIPIDAYVTIFSVSDISSYNQIVKSVRTLRNVHQTNKAIIMVGNKIDLARQRRVPKQDALRVARKYNCRYIETSAALNHHVDELLVGILSQIREQISPSASNKLELPSDGKHRSRSKSPAKAITDFFSKIFAPNDKRAKSCETLFVE